MSRNPYYRKDKPPALQNSVFVIMDILGYRAMILESEKSGRQQQVLRKLHKALLAGRSGLEDNRTLLEDDESDLYALKHLRTTL